MKYPEITFNEFRALMEQRNHDVDGLVDMFRGKIDDPREFFERVMSCRVKIGGRYEDRGECVIPYRSVNRLVTFRGETPCLAEWAERLGVDRMTLSHRLKRGEALTI